MNNRKISGFLLTAIVVLILAASLFIGDTVGLSDNADFSRIMKPNRISYETGARTPFIFENRFKLSFSREGGLEELYDSLFTLTKPYVTTHHIFIKASILLNLSANALTGTDYEAYHIEWLGMVYCIFLALSLSVVFFKVCTGKKWFDAVFFFLTILIFCDTAYTGYFNSFYGEAVQYASFIFIFAMAAVTIFSPRPKTVYCLLYYAGLAIFAGSKFANIPLGIVLAVAGLSFMFLKESGRVFKIVTVAGFIFVMVLSAYFYSSIPKWMDRDTTYQAVFFGVLKDSPEPERDLEQLGLPSYMAALKNTNYYMEGHKIDIYSTKFKKDFYGSISKFKVLGFYLRNPARFWQKLDISCKNSAHIKPHYLSNYGAGHERVSTSNKFNVWSRLRLKLPLDNIYFILLLLISSFLIILLEFRSACQGKDSDYRKIISCIFCTALLLVTAINLVIPFVSNGEADIDKHMFGFITGVDLIFLLAILWLLYRLPRVISKVRNKMNFARMVMPFTVLLLLVVCLSIILAQMKDSFDNLVPGAYVHFGKYNGKELLWRIIHTDDNGILLFANDAVDFAPFDANPGNGDENRLKYGSNYWPESSIRKWLNEDFIKDFNDNEKALIKVYKNKILLSSYDAEKAEGGCNDFFWTHVPSQADFGFEDAWHAFAYDRVFLPDVSQFRQYLSDKGFVYARRYGYWLETIYFANSSMVRVVGTDGYVYMKDAAAEKTGVRPALYLADNAVISGGSGNRKHPFTIQ